MLQRRKPMKKRQPRYRQRTPSSQLPKILFTWDQLNFLRETLLPLEYMVLDKDTSASIPNFHFAFATIIQVTARVNQMIQQDAQQTGVEFDANEVLILQTAVWMFSTVLDAIEPSPESENFKQQCRKLDSLFKPISPHVKTWEV
jgi:hypothetical protein